MRAELGNTELEKAFDQVSGLSERASIDRVTRSFQRKYEFVRHLGSPFAEGFWRLCAVERAVDLNRGQMFGRVG